MLERCQSYDDLVAGFRWRIPARYNIGVDVCDKWARSDPDRLALIHLHAGGTVKRYRFTDLMRLSNKLANALAAGGLQRGDRVAILLPQALETALAHIATYKLGAIAVPLFALFGAEALQFRLSDSGAKVVITDRGGLAKLEEIRDRLPALQRIISTEPAGGAETLQGLLQDASDTFAAVDTAADDPALIIYTSGTTGPPKGALHAHRVLLGHLPGVEMPHNFFPHPGDLFWTPADWAWIGGLIDVLLPSWHHGVPVLAHRFAKFDPEEAFRLMADFQVRNVFMPPTALKMMRQVSNPRERWNHALRTLGSGGESLGDELIAWGEQAFGVTMNEFYGQTECNLVVSGCADLMPARPGAIGRAVPGHSLAIVDEGGQERPTGDEGLIAVRRPDPVMFLGYWQNPEATRDKFVGDWLVTGDRGARDEDGYISFIGRDDDVISSGGYRIGPGEIEDCLLKHPAVALAAAVGIPDRLRGERVKAFIVLSEGHRPDAALAAAIQDYVKQRLAAHEYPREVAFVDSLPMTTTGKIMRRKLRQAPDG